MRWWNTVKTRVDSAYRHVFLYPASAALTKPYSIGFMLLVMMTIQIITGIFLSFHYIAIPEQTYYHLHTHVYWDVNYGFIAYGYHVVGPTVITVLMVLHIFKALTLKSYSYEYRQVWVSGILIFLIFLAAAFFGCTLANSQMSFWASKVVLTVPAIIPGIGEKIQVWLLGADTPMTDSLRRFYLIHVILSLAIVPFILGHLYFLHKAGSSSPVELPEANHATKGLSKYFFYKDIEVLVVVLAIYSYYALLEPTMFSPGDHFIEADPLKTPKHILPMWYFWPLYTILRTFESKVVGLTLVVMVFVILFMYPWLYRLNQYVVKDLSVVAHAGELVHQIAVIWLACTIWQLGSYCLKPLTSENIDAAYFDVIFFFILLLAIIFAPMLGHIYEKIRNYKIF